ncbi:hypothetical protein N4T77_04510 [Clostridium sp. CX1]|uniref:hypothetical protein n=1 Tax=Clostridium sp. CX1 TaxID=2978346 RepID=UPI0021C0859E|nr:hypothetical protein [Clostridium sp. CX1]MCT8975854.1 hypothetical protein [Clostridium sp. CX1]
MDTCYEQLLTTYKTVKYRSLRFTSCLGAILGILMILVKQIVAGGFLLILSILIFYLKRYLYIEYEYKFNKGELVIEKIVARKDRKKVVYFNLKNVEILAKENSKYLKGLADTPKKKIKLYPVTCKETVYTAIVKDKEQRVQVKFVPDDTLINLCYKYNPNVVKKN